jgi:cell division protein FtsB
VTRWRWLALAVVVAAAVFAFNGGQYSQAEYRALRREEATIRQRIDSLSVEVDSLRLFHDSLLSSPVVQERLARERLGMIRPGEILILLVPDSGAP